MEARDALALTDLGPDSTAARVARWRAVHIRIDPLLHVLGNEVGLRLLDPGDGWRRCPDMNPQGTRRSRAPIVARAAGFREARHVSAAALTKRYFDGRPDGLRPSGSEELLVATT